MCTIPMLNEPFFILFILILTDYDNTDANYCLYFGISVIINFGFIGNRRISRCAIVQNKPYGFWRSYQQDKPPSARSNYMSHRIKHFISWMLINSNKRSAVGGSWNPGTSALIPEGAVSTWH